MKRRITAIALLALLCADSSAASAVPYQNPALSAEERVDDLLARMTLVEKIGHIQKSEKNRTLAEMQAGDAQGIYPNLHSSGIPALIERGEIGSFLHVKNPSEANRLQAHASKSRLGIPLLIGIDAVHGNGLVRGSTIYPTPLTMASSWNVELVRRANVETARANFEFTREQFGLGQANSTQFREAQLNLLLTHNNLNNINNMLGNM